MSQAAKKTDGRGKKPTKAQVQKVADSASLTTVELKECTFGVDKGLLQELGGRLNIRVDVNTKLVSVEPDAFLVEATTEILHKDAAEKSVSPLNAKLVWTVVYTLSEPVEREAVFAFMRGNTMVHVWPYTREFVQSMTTRMGMPPLILPLLVLGRPLPTGSTPE